MLQMRMSILLLISCLNALTIRPDALLGSTVNPIKVATSLIDIATNPFGLVQCPHDHMLHGCLIGCGQSGLTDKRGNCELVRDYKANNCRNQGSVIGAVTTAQNLIVSFTDQHRAKENNCRTTDLQSCSQLVDFYSKRCY